MTIKVKEEELIERFIAHLSNELVTKISEDVGYILWDTCKQLDELDEPLGFYLSVEVAVCYYRLKEEVRCRDEDLNK